MNEQFKPKSMESSEKPVDQIYEELNQVYDEIMKLMDHVHGLEIKAGEERLSKEKFDLIVDERNKLAAQLDEKWELEKQLQEKWKRAWETEIKKSEERQ